MPKIPERSNRIALVYDAAAAEGDVASRDVFDQLDAVEAVLAGVEEGRRFGVSLDLGRLKGELEAFQPDGVVNLVESVSGVDRLQVLVPLLLEEMGIPFTGCGSEAMLLANDKIGCKRFLAAHGLPVPAALGEETGEKKNWLVKAVSAHASLHLDDASVLRDATREEAAAKIRAEERAHGIAFFAEEFIEGREFNISLLGNQDGGATVFPPAEIDFSALPSGREQIVGYAAKWAEDSAEYAGTVRHFDFPESDAALLGKLASLSEKTWRVMNLSGYARVDYRVDADGQPYILEVNVNPCLTPGAGFPAAAERAGLSYADLIRAILKSSDRSCRCADAGN